MIQQSVVLLLPCAILGFRTPCFPNLHMRSEHLAMGHKQCSGITLACNRTLSSGAHRPPCENGTDPLLADRHRCRLFSSLVAGSHASQWFQTQAGSTWVAYIVQSCRMEGIPSSHKPISDHPHWTAECQSSCKKEHYPSPTSALPTCSKDCLG